MDIELLYPRHCPICDRLLKDRETFVCRACSGSLKFIEGPVCMKCGRPLSSDQKEFCVSCRKTSHRFLSGFAPFTYSGPIRESLMRFKYGGRAEYARFYSAAIAAYGKRKLELWRPELILPVPVHPGRYLKRGYNQAEELALCLSEDLAVPACCGLLVRTRNTVAQKELKTSDRKRNLSGAFRADRRVLRTLLDSCGKFPERVLLCDDIYTTGATMDALAEEAEKCGAKEVHFASISVAPGDG